VDYNWHPLVHSAYFEESLYYVLVRLRDPLHRPVAEQIGKVVAKAEITHACEYSLFGWWDALIRVWLTRSSYRRFLKVLEDKALHNIEDFQGFTTTQMYYFWNRKTDDGLAENRAVLAAIASHSKAIDAVAAIPTLTDSKEWRALKKAKLVFERKPMPAGGVKFYTTLKRVSDDMPVAQETQTILAAMSETHVGDTNARMVDRATLYHGSGTLADYLVRCVADNYDDVLALAEAFDIKLQNAKLRPMTLLVANPKPRESDHINDTIHLSHNDAANATVLGFDSPRALAKLTTQQRAELHKLITTACEAADADEEALRNQLLEMLRATATNSYRDLHAALLYLLDFEPIFKDLFLRLMTAHFGQNWYAMIVAFCLESDEWHQHGLVIQDVKPSKWGLGTFIFTARAACDLDARFRGRLERRLGPRWNGELDSLLSLRNDFAHGRVHEFERLDAYDPALIAFLGQAMTSAVFVAKCENGSTQIGVEPNA
jgi:hypothetical protein